MFPMPVVKKQSTENILNQIYFNAQHPGSFGGIDRLSKAAKTSPKTTEKFLKKQWTYQFHKPIRKNFPRRRYVTRGINEQWQADLIEMQHYSHINSGFRYILCVIDIFSRYAYGVPLKTKTGPEVAKAFEYIFETSGNKPKYLQTDQGLEFYNVHVKKVLEKYGVELFSVFSDKKSAIVERYQKTLKERMFRAFTFQGNYKWLDLLPKIIDSYNNSYHRSIKTAPAKVNKMNETKIWFTQYGNVKTEAKAKFNVGDRVRIQKERNIFSKGYIEKWTDEEFIIHSINTKYEPALYTLKDSNNEIIQGSFYEKELQLIDNPTDLYRIDRIIRTRMVDGIKEALVKWKGFAEPSWINYSNVKPIN